MPSAANILNSIGKGLSAIGRTKAATDESVSIPAMESLGKSLGRLIGKRSVPQPDPSETGPPAAKRGGLIRKTGTYRLHSGEIVIPRNIVGKLRKIARQKRSDSRH